MAGESSDNVCVYYYDTALCCVIILFHCRKHDLVVAMCSFVVSSFSLFTEYVELHLLFIFQYLLSLYA